MKTKLSPKTEVLCSYFKCQPSCWSVSMIFPEHSIPGNVIANIADIGDNPENCTLYLLYNRMIKKELKGFSPSSFCYLAY